MEATQGNSQEYLLEIKGVSKTFPGVQALNHVDLCLKSGEVLALVGENGAGKSTLMKILAGVQEADHGSGQILLEGKPVWYKSALEAKQDGIIMVFQELSLVMDLSVSENIFLGSLPLSKLNNVKWKELYAKTAQVLEEIDCPISPQTIVRNLPIAQQQLVEIGRALALGAKIVVLDEPTSSLTEKEQVILFNNIRKLKERGVGVIYISHRMDEIFQISDRITVFRDGKNSGELITAQTDLAGVVSCMIGRNLNEYYHRNGAESGEEILRVEGLSLKDHFEDINLSVKRNEVVGLYGLVGAGRTEIVETIFGIRKKSAGKLFFEGKAVDILTSKDAVELGIALVPENRKTQGLVLQMSCRDNAVLAKLPWIANKIGVVNKEAPNAIYKEFHAKLNIQSPSPRQKVVLLSGGNQQKVVIAKWMSLSPKLLILDEPTRGIDIGSKAEIHKLIAEFAESGMGVIVISSEMPEIIGISNRVIAITQGKITAEFSKEEITEKNLIQAVTF